MATQRSPSIPMTDASGDNDRISKDLSLDGLDIGDSLSVDKSFNLYIKSVSWPTEGRGLLHVLSPMVYSKDFKVRSANGVYFMSRDESEMYLHRDTSDIPASSQLVARLTMTSTGVIVETTESPEPEGGKLLIPQSEMWAEIPKDGTGTVVECGNVVRFGSYKVKIVDVALTLEQLINGAPLRDLGLLKPLAFNDCISDASSSLMGSDHSGSGPVCRICFEGPEEATNPLVSPCVCSGSLRYIHLDCLRRWLNGQLQVKEFESGGGSYFIRAIKCEICKSIYSKKIYQSILIPRPKVPHIILEDFAPGAGSSRVHIIPLLADRPIRIGRSKENDLVLSDISVSRMHASLAFDEGILELSDLHSKFGSLVQLPSRIFHAAAASPLRVQLGSALLELQVAVPGRLEKLVPERFLQEKGVVRLIKCKSPSDKVLEADRLRRNRSSLPNSNDNSPQYNPTSPAATLNTSFQPSFPNSPARNLNESS